MLCDDAPCPCVVLGHVGDKVDGAGVAAGGERDVGHVVHEEELEKRGHAAYEVNNLTNI